jgi:hypothetical protein
VRRSRKTFASKLSWRENQCRRTSFHPVQGNDGEASPTPCQNLVEQRKRRSMAPCVVDVNECRVAVMWAQGIVPKIVSSIEVFGKFVSRRNHCA